MEIEKTIGEVHFEHDIAFAMKQISDTLGNLANTTDDQLRELAYREAQLAVLNASTAHLKAMTALLDTLKRGAEPFRALRLYFLSLNGGDYKWIKRMNSS